MNRPAETIEYHTHLLRLSIEVEHCRSYWQHVEEAAAENLAEEAFSDYWFGARSKSRVDLLLANLKERFDAFPPSLFVLHGWQNMEPGTRRLICHWHLQLTDLLYRRFTGKYLVQRKSNGRTEVTRDLVVRWIEEEVPDRWSTSTRIEFARKLLFCASEAGLLKGERDPRLLQTPRISDDAITYLLYLLRNVDFEGSLTDNLYVASVGLIGHELERRLRPLPAFRFRKQGELVEFGWQYASLRDWAEATVFSSDTRVRGTA